MKPTALIFALISLAYSSLFATTLETAPITGDDIKNILDLNANKFQVSFDSPRRVTLRCESWGSGKHKQDFPLNGLTKTITLLTYAPAPRDGVPVIPLHFWITGAEGTTYSSFSFDSSKTKAWRSGIIDGVFTIAAFETKDFSKTPVYRIQVLTSDE